MGMVRLFTIASLNNWIEATGEGVMEARELLKQTWNLLPSEVSQIPHSTQMDSQSFPEEESE